MSPHRQTFYTYDANGNLTVADSDTYTWDWSDRLVAATVAGNNVSYSYDAFDVRVGTTLNGTTSNYLWDRQATYLQLVDDTRTYAYLHNAGPLAQIDGSGNRQYLLTDALHSVRGLVDGAGALVGTTEYAAFGALRNQTGMTSSMGFTGELFSVATGLLHLLKRDLNPPGRFLSVDTVSPMLPAVKGSMPMLMANNPTTWVDPSGISSVPAAFGNCGAGSRCCCLRCSHCDVHCRSAGVGAESGSWRFPENFRTSGINCDICCHFAPVLWPVVSQSAGWDHCRQWLRLTLWRQALATGGIARCAGYPSRIAILAVPNSRNTTWHDDRNGYTAQSQPESRTSWLVLASGHFDGPGDSSHDMDNTRTRAQSWSGNRSG
ncbi:MAG: RHS repeat-associated core domain-containing protein [Caldilineaceae bacterium]